MNKPITENPLSSIPDAELSHTLYLKGRERAEAEREWSMQDDMRLVVLAELTEYYLLSSKSQTEAERKARRSREYNEFLAKKADAKRAVHLARSKFDAVDHEIRMRINKSFEHRTEYHGGRLQT